MSIVYTRYVLVYSIRGESCIYMSMMYTLSLGTLVPNSRDRHEKQWRPDFTRHKTHPKIRFV